MLFTLARLEETVFSTWLRESQWGFFTALTFHSLAMGLVVGINIALSLRVLGFANRVPLSLMSRFLPLMWLSALVILSSGLLLLLAYPAKALTNEVFYLKLALIIVALIITQYFYNRLMTGQGFDNKTLPRSARTLAMLSLFFWAGGVAAGRFLAYTHSVLLASSFY